MCELNVQSGYIALGAPQGRIWTVPAIHGDLRALLKLHDAIFAKFTPGDRIIYLGNYTGYGEYAAACIEEILTFRRLMMARHGVLATDITYLRGRQEEIWQKLLQLQFAPDPTNVLLWMLGNGLNATLLSYGVSPHDGIEACRYGIMDITRWTSKIRAAIRQHPGHEIFANQLKRAAYTCEDHAHPMAFVHAGLHADYALKDQGDYLWWGDEEFDRLHAAYAPFQTVVRGFDPAHRGLALQDIKATVDNGCGFGGSLVSVAFEVDGSIFDIVER